MSETSPYSLGVATPAPAAGAPYAELIAPATSAIGGAPMAITMIAATLQAATASSIGLAQSTVKGTPSTSATGFQEDFIGTGGVSVSTIATAWSVLPTLVTLKFIRRIVLPATAGATVVWTWDEEHPLILQNTKSLLLWNFGGGAGSILDLNIRWYEAARFCGPRIRNTNDPFRQNTL